MFCVGAIEAHQQQLAAPADRQAVELEGWRAEVLPTELDVTVFLLLAHADSPWFTRCSWSCNNISAFQARRTRFVSQVFPSLVLSLRS